MLRLVSPITYAAWNPNRNTEQSLIAYIIKKTTNNREALNGHLTTLELPDIKKYEGGFDMDDVNDAVIYIMSNPMVKMNSIDLSVTSLFESVLTDNNKKTISFAFNSHMNGKIKSLQRRYDSIYDFSGLTPQAQRLYDLILHKEAEDILTRNLEDFYGFFKLHEKEGTTYMRPSQYTTYIKKVIKTAAKEVEDITGYSIKYTYNNNDSKSTPDIDIYFR